MSLYGRVMIWLVGVGLELLVAFLIVFLPFWRQALPLANPLQVRGVATFCSLLTIEILRSIATASAHSFCLCLATA
jgi:hypothetical protein